MIELLDAKYTNARVRRLLKNHKNDAPAIYIDLADDYGTWDDFSGEAPNFFDKKIITIGGRVSSIGLALFLLGDKRYVMDQAIFVFQEIKTVPKRDGGYLICEKSIIPEFKCLVNGKRINHQKQKGCQNEMLDLLSEKSGIRRNILVNLMSEKKLLRAPDLIRYGIAHGIVSRPEDFASLASR